MGIYRAYLTKTESSAVCKRQWRPVPMEIAIKDIRKHARELHMYRTAVVMAFAILASSGFSQAQELVARSPYAKYAIGPDIGWNGGPRRI